MDSTSEVNSIEDKKNGTNEKKPDVMAFIKNYSGSIIFTICLGVIIFGSVGLYTTKVAMAGVLPSTLNASGERLTLKITDKTPKYVDMNIVKLLGFYGLNIFSEPEEVKYQRAEFNPEKVAADYKNGPVCAIINSSDKSPFFLYISSVVNYMVAANNTAINYVYRAAGECISEDIILLLYPIVSALLFPAMYIFNFVVSIISHATFLHQLFRQKDKSGGWEPVDDISYLNLTNGALFAFIWWWVCIISVFVMTPCICIYSILSPLMSTYTILGRASKKPYHFGTFLKDTFWYKKNLIMALAMLSLLYNTYTYLGSEYVIGAVVAVIVSIVGFNSLGEMGTFPYQHTSSATDKMLDPKIASKTYKLCSVKK
jgi:hypothetical protein